MFWLIWVYFGELSVNVLIRDWWYFVELGFGDEFVGGINLCLWNLDMFLLNGDRMEELSFVVVNFFCCLEIFYVCVDEMWVVICVVGEGESDNFDCLLV